MILQDKNNPSFIFCQYCRAEFGYDKVLDKYKYCPYDGHKLQPISIKVPPYKRPIL